MLRYLITGGCGFIGSHLARALLAQGHRVRVLDNLSAGRRENLDSRVEFIRGDATDAEVVAEAMAGISGCFHLAALSSVQDSSDDWRGGHAANQTASVVVFDAARQRNGRGPVPIVYASSAAVYGEQASPAAESATVAPLTCYGVDKIGTELHGRIAWMRHGIPNIGLRMFNVYGARGKSRSSYADVTSIFLDQLLSNRPLTVYGDGCQVRDFVHMRDVVDHLLAAMVFADKEARVLNVCTGTGTSINTLIGAIADALGVRPAINHRETRGGDIRVSIGDPTLARNVLNMKARISLEAGVAELVAYARTKPRLEKRLAKELSDSRS